MKKLLAIIVLGLALASCSEYSEKKKISTIQKCADPNAMEYGALRFDKNGKPGIGFLSSDAKKSHDPLGLYKDENLKEINNVPLQNKLKNKTYEKIWDKCETEFHEYPVKFKQKYLKWSQH